VVEIPAVAMEQPDQAGHFYVAVTVNTEAQVASFKGFVRHDQVGAAIDGVYPVAMEAMEWDGDRLFFLAMGLDRGAIVLPQVARGAVMAPIRQMVVRPVMDAIAWGKRQVEQSLDTFFALMDGSNLEMASAFRGDSATISVANPFQEIRPELIQQGLDIPINVQAKYEDILVDGVKVRVAIAKWQMPQDEPSEILEWSLLVVAKSLDDLTGKVLVVIEHQASAINQIELSDRTSYRFMQAIGDLTDIFLITISYGQTELVLPPVSLQF
jgi:hypothetical protein